MIFIVCDPDVVIDQHFWHRCLILIEGHHQQTTEAPQALVVHTDSQTPAATSSAAMMTEISTGKLTETNCTHANYFVAMSNGCKIFILLA